MLLLGKTVEFICHLPVSVSYLHTLEHPTAHYISDADGSIEGKVVVVVNTSLEREIAPSVSLEWREEPYFWLE